METITYDDITIKNKESLLLQEVELMETKSLKLAIAEYFIASFIGSGINGNVDVKVPILYMD